MLTIQRDKKVSKRTHSYSFKVKANLDTFGTDSQNFV